MNFHRCGATQGRPRETERAAAGAGKGAARLRGARAVWLPLLLGPGTVLRDAMMVVDVCMRM